jgi:transposase
MLRQIASTGAAPASGREFAQRLEDAMGIVRLLDQQQPGNMITLNSTLAEPASKNNKDPKRVKAKQIFLGIDAHLRSNQVARKLDNGAIGSVQNLSFEELLLFGCKQTQLGEQVYAVYEAGPLGNVLYRRLKELGVEAYVSAPECLEQGKRKHNKLDARKLCSRLYSYVQGDKEMMRVVWVPSLEEEQLRAHSRQYDQLVAQRKSVAAQGRSLVLCQGFGSIGGAWWRPRAYSKFGPLLPSWIQDQLQVFRANLELLDHQIAERKKELIQSNQEVLPKGFGAQTRVQLDREIGDWNRFSNRRKVGCFFGFVPREHSTGTGQRLGSITKVGSSRLRAKSIELVWRLARFQPNYGPILQWSESLKSSNKVLKKKAAVAVARRVVIDIWKMRTGRKTAQELGLVLNHCQRNQPPIQHAAAPF